MDHLFQTISIKCKIKSDILLTVVNKLFIDVTKLISKGLKT